MSVPLVIFNGPTQEQLIAARGRSVEAMVSWHEKPPKGGASLRPAIREMVTLQDVCRESSLLWRFEFFSSALGGTTVRVHAYVAWDGTRRSDHAFYLLRR